MKTYRVFTLFFLTAGIATAGTSRQPDTGTNSLRITPAYINELAELMRTNHPGLRALDARVRAAVHATNAVRTWEDPMFKLGGAIATEQGPDLEHEGDLIYELEQKLPLFGKPAAERRVMQTETELALARHELRFQLSRRDLAKLIFSAAYAEAVLDVGRRDLEWLDTMVTVTDERYRAGTASQPELLRIQNERSRRADMLKTDTLMRDQSWVSVNRLINRPLDARWPRFELPDVWPEVPYKSRLVDYALKFEPQLRLMTREIKVAEAQVAATRKARLPEVFAGVEGRQYSGDGNFREGMFTVGLSLPWFNRGRYQSDLARDRARLEAAELERASEELVVREDIRRMVIDIDAARREALLYRDEILPRSRQAFEVAYANWTSARGMFLETMDARRMLLEAELTFARAVSRQFTALSELVLCCGLGDLESLEMILTEEEKP